MKTKIKADTKLTIMMCSQICDKQFTAPLSMLTWTKTPGA